MAHSDQPVIAAASTLLTVSVEGKSTRTPDLAVFSAGVTTQGSTAGEAMTAAEAQTLSLLAGIDPDTLTPREALDALYKLKSVISS